MNGFLDYLKDKYGITSDRALSKALGVTAPCVCKWRKGTLSFGSTMILRVHDLTGMSIKEIKERIA
jgi:hypothetical protein